MKTVTVKTPRVVNVQLVEEDGKARVGLMMADGADYYIITLDQEQADDLYWGLDNCFCKQPGCKGSA